MGFAKKFDVFLFPGDFFLEGIHQLVGIVLGNRTGGGGIAVAPWRALVWPSIYFAFVDEVGIGAIPSGDLIRFITVGSASSNLVKRFHRF